MIKKYIKFHSLRVAIKKLCLFYRGRVISSPVEFRPKDGESILVLAPHPDDESIGFGGFLLRYGSKVDVVCITDGGLGITGFLPEKTREVRRCEFIDAMNKCQVRNYLWLGVPDGSVQDALSKIRSLPLCDYTYIAIPNWLDTHPDHSALTQLIIEAYAAGDIPNKVNIIFYEVWNSLAIPTHFTDLTDIAEKKRELINLYRSQVANINYSDHVLQLNTFRGMASGVRCAEAYTIIPVSLLRSIL